MLAGAVQVLHERGFWGKCVCCNKALQLTRSKNAPESAEHTWARKIIAAWPEVASQKSTLEETVLQRGHIIIYSPICHPEASAL